ncbi:MAG: hypothetical protein NT099_05380 [Candidatus Saganbacteria bacterium]|nr:hypothetical protein [Candidatus Saganbacteria bacterium]
MKGILILYAPALEEQVMAAMKRVGAKQYTKLPALHGVGGHSEPHLDTQVWPGTNTGIMVVTDESTKDKLLKEMKALKTEYIKEGVKVFVLPVEEEI